MSSAAHLRRVARTVLAATIVVALASPLLTAPMAVRAKSAITVSNNGDLPDFNGTDCTCATGATGTACSLRAAIQTANACSGADLILFAANYTITPTTTALPALSDASGGTTIASKGRAIVLDGTNVTAGVGLSLTSDGNAVQGLTIQSFGSYNVAVSGDNNIVGTDGDGGSDAQERNVIILSADTGVYVTGDNNRVTGNYIGLDSDGSTVQANAGGGVKVTTGSGNVIGTNGDGVADDAERNVISGNTASPAGNAYGVLVTSGAAGTRVAGNYIGTNAFGSESRPNTGSGVIVSSGATGTVVGTNGDGQADAAERNVVSGNGAWGVNLRAVAVVAGNYIGLGADGATDLGNTSSGIFLDYQAGSRIGTNADGVSDSLERNVISGNGSRGIEVWTSANDNVVAGNYIGTDYSGLVAVANTARGVYISGGTGNRIGGLAVAERNVISGNTGGGIVTSGGASGTQILGNYIGVGTDGVTALPNTTAGVWLRSGSTGVSIGSAEVGGGNVIARNSSPGIFTDSDATILGNTIRGNAIFQNAGLGIDLNSGSPVVTANDGGDGDAGPNGLQNYPVLAGALTAADGSSSLIAGSLNSAAAVTFTLDFYSGDTCDASGNGEGERELGS
ncbi:MAG: beta strand repeat-containing protein, partial [Anaerolineae bacterium]